MLIVVAAIVVALLIELRRPAVKTAPQSPGVEAPLPGGGDLSALQRQADLPRCPSDRPGPGPPALRGLSVTCLADGAPANPAGEVSGRQVLLNLWAYWCAPCARELPAMAEYQRRVGGELMVIAVHQDNDAAAALSRLAEWGVRLPTWQDGGRRVAAALRVPNVLPASVLLRADGTVAGILPRAFDSADEIAAAVDQTMGAPG